MNYEIVKISEKMVVGLNIRTSNNDVNMTKDIGMLWHKFYNQEIYQSILNKKNDCSIGLYSNYKNGVCGEYDVTVCCEVTKNENLSNETEIRIIPKGKYAKFVIKGDVQKSVGEFWSKLWDMDLDRKYDCDFEEYQPGGDMNNSEIHIYISLN